MAPPNCAIVARMYDPGLAIETDRLVLRMPRLEDLDRWCLFLGDEESARHVGGVQPRPVVWRGLASMAGAWAIGGCAMFSVIEKSSGLWIGRLGPWCPEGWPGTEVGWGLMKEYWGRGYATEGAIAAIDWCFDHLGWDEVIHVIAPANHASRQVARRLGSRLRGPARLPEPVAHIEVECWGQTRAEWRAQRARLPLAATP